MCAFFFVVYGFCCLGSRCGVCFIGIISFFSFFFVDCSYFWVCFGSYLTAKKFSLTVAIFFVYLLTLDCSIVLLLVLTVSIDYRSARACCLVCMFCIFLARSQLSVIGKRTHVLTSSRANGSGQIQPIWCFCYW